MKEEFMKLAIEEAKKGKGYVNPNPLVGAVIVKNGIVIATGYHEHYGGPHAEVSAINNAYLNNIDIRDSEMYVTLEPCSHYGKTPPCADRIIKEGIKKVYIGISDPNPLVNGNGINKLKSAGIIVETGILEDEIREMNRVFIKHISEKKPYVILKLALTLDGFIADSDGYSKWISNESSRKIVHEMRSEHMAVLAGSGTVLKDNPSLNVRLNTKRRNPIRIILDKNGETSNLSELNIYNIEGKNIIFTSSSNQWNYDNTEVIRNNSLDIEFILKELNKRNIDSVLVEGGANIASQFINHADTVILFHAPVLFGNGIKPFSEIKNKISLKTKDIKVIDNNTMWLLERSDDKCSQE